MDARQVLFTSWAFSMLYVIGFLLDWSMDTEDRVTNVYLSRIFGIAFSIVLGLAAAIKPKPWKNDLCIVLLSSIFALGYSYSAYFYTFRLDLAQSYIVYGMFMFILWLNVCTSVQASFFSSMSILTCAIVNHIFFIQTSLDVMLGYVVIWTFALVAGYIIARNLQFVPRRDYAIMKSLQTEIERRGAIENELQVYQNELEELVSSKTTELQEREQQLLHAQRMESIGQLAGGIAHDFNNLLMVILGYSEMASNSDDLAVVRRYQEEIELSGLRGVELTRQLLAFGRRQVMDMNVADLPKLVTGMFGMIRPVIPENIEIETVVPEHTLAVTADSGQIEQVMMNLIINARDAMQEGGCLKIIVDSVIVNDNDPRILAGDSLNAGRFATIAVVDTGTGISTEVQEHIFDPFYSTKPKEQGTGLGLAVVFGIIRQHGGFIDVESSVGSGTTFKIYLPVEAETISNDTSVAAPLTDVRGSETILVVEDEDRVRTLAREILERAGYSVLDAHDGQEGMSIIESQGGTISLVLLDVVMPRMGGPEMYDRLRNAGFQMPVLFSSGYAADGVHTDFVLNEGIELLQKPYGAKVLLQRVRQSLDRV